MLKQKGLPTLRFWFWEILRILGETRPGLSQNLDPETRGLLYATMFRENLKQFPYILGAIPFLRDSSILKPSQENIEVVDAFIDLQAWVDRLSFQQVWRRPSNIFSPRPQFHDVPRGYPWWLYVGDEDNHG